MRQKQKDKIVKIGVIFTGVLFILSLVGGAMLYSSGTKPAELPLNPHLIEQLTEQQKYLLFSHGGSLLTLKTPSICDESCTSSKDAIYNFVEEYGPFVYLYEEESNNLEITYEAFGLVETYPSMDEESVSEIQMNICNNLAPFGRTKAAEKCMLLKAMENY